MIAGGYHCTCCAQSHTRHSIIYGRFGPKCFMNFWVTVWRNQILAEGGRCGEHVNTTTTQFDTSSIPSTARIPNMERSRDLPSNPWLSAVRFYLLKCVDRWSSLGGGNNYLCCWLIKTTAPTVHFRGGSFRR